uniref:Uncharacterized protein n=1 Tax=Trichuris muris TaxID=70415 RepID=A0A5S6PZ55_TRIMR
MTVYVRCTPVEAVVPRWGKPLRAVMFAQGRLFRERMKSTVAPPIACHRKSAKSMVALPTYSMGSRLYEKNTRMGETIEGSKSQNAKFSKSRKGEEVNSLAKGESKKPTLFAKVSVPTNLEERYADTLRSAEIAVNV